VGRAFTTGLAAVATIALLANCGSSDADGAVRSHVLSCITDGGGTLDEDADVVVAGGKALAVVAIEAPEAVINQCLDLANG
jgi:hypothetical protein